MLDRGSWSVCVDAGVAVAGGGGGGDVEMHEVI